VYIYFNHSFTNIRLNNSDHIIVGFTTTWAFSTYYHLCCEFESRSWRGVLDTTLCDQVCQWLAPVHRVQRSIRGDCYVKRGVSVSKRLICEHGKFITKANYKFYLKNIYRWKTKQANKRKRKQIKNCDTFLVLCDLVLSTIKQHIYAKPVKWSVRLMFLLNFQVEVIINMFIKREPTPYKKHQVNSPYSTFRDWRFVYGVFGGKSCRVWFVV
jgi:hypothetical protein